MGAAVPVGWLAGGFIYFFVPPGGGGGGAGLVAKDALGDAVTKAGWTGKHQAGDRSLVQGLKGDAHYLIVEGDGSIRNYALNAVALIWAASSRGTGLRISSCAHATAASTTRRARSCVARLHSRLRSRTWISTRRTRSCSRPGLRPTSARTRRPGGSPKRESSHSAAQRKEREREKEK